MANFAGNYGWPFVAAAGNNQVKNAQGGVIAFLPVSSSSGTIDLYDGTSTADSHILAAFPVTAGQPVIIALAFSKGLFAVLTNCAGTFSMS